MRFWGLIHSPTAIERVACICSDPGDNLLVLSRPSQTKAPETVFVGSNEVICSCTEDIFMGKGKLMSRQAQERYRILAKLLFQRGETETGIVVVGHPQISVCSIDGKHERYRKVGRHGNSESSLVAGPEYNRRRWRLEKAV